jgi:hypothetical protein
MHHKSLIDFIVFCVTVSSFAACSRRSSQENDAVDEPVDGESSPREQEKRFALTEDSPYLFYLDDGRHDSTLYSLQRYDSEPGPGDIATVMRMALRLGEPGSYRMSSYDEGKTIVLVNEKGGESLAGFTITSEFSGYETWTGGHPVKSLDADQVARLQGLRIESWGPAADAMLALIDPSKTCVTLANDESKARTLPAIPTNLECLVVDDSLDTAPLLKRMPWLAKLGELQFLSFRSPNPLDLHWVRGHEKLRYLRAPKIAHARHLASLSGLISLVVTQPTKDIGFLAGMAKLQKLSLVEHPAFPAPVRDLRPISKAPSLEVVVANGAPVDTLPLEALPQLRELRVLATKLDDDQVAKFRKLNPQCIVLHREEDALERASKGIDRVVARGGGTCRPGGGRRLFGEIRGQEAVQEFMSKIEFDENAHKARCACCGHPAFDLYREGELVETLGLHHGKRIRWPEGWSYDATLTEGSARFLLQWLKNRGFEYPPDVDD